MRSFAKVGKWLLPVLMLAFWAAPVPAASLPEMMFILDGSGSMWGQAGGQAKITIAKEVLARVVPSLPKGVRVGLAVYGHRRKGDCRDVQVLMPPGSRDRARLLALVRGVKPKGKTPIAHSIKLVAGLLKSREAETTIVLVSDGLETCDPDPCGVVKALKDSGIKFVLHVVGFGVGRKGEAQLSCLARAGGGRYFAAKDAAGLAKAMEAVKTQVKVKVARAKTKVVKAKSLLGRLHLTVPTQGLATFKKYRIIRKKDKKLIKEGAPKADETHPLLRGLYTLMIGHANPNYRPPTWGKAVDFIIEGGATTHVRLGALVPNPAKGLGDPVYELVLIKKGRPGEWMRIPALNRYYIFKAKALPPGVYDLLARYARSPRDTVIARGVKVAAGQAVVLSLNTAVALKKPKGQAVTGWDLVPRGGKSPTLSVRRRFDNDYPLWKKFLILPGSYDLKVHVRGMSEALPALSGVKVPQGSTIVMDSNL